MVTPSSVSVLWARQSRPLSMSKKLTVCRTWDAVKNSWVETKFRWWRELTTGWWLSLPLWKIWVFPIYGKIKNVPNHQPDQSSTWGFPEMGVPQMDDLQWKLLLKWMMKWGTSIYGNLQINFRHFSSMDWFKRSSAGKACFPPWKMKVSFPCVRPPRYLVALRWRSGIVSWWIVHINAI